MCSTATQHLGGCLELVGASWQDAGYADERGFFHACETWAWSTRMLESEEGPTDATTHQCESWEAAINDDDFSCVDFDGLDWNSTPW